MTGIDILQKNYKANVYQKDNGILKKRYFLRYFEKGYQGLYHRHLI